MLASYTPPKVVEPPIHTLQPPKKGLFSSLFPPEVVETPLMEAPKKGLFASLFGGSSTTYGKPLPISDSLPKGLYMFGDVGSGKTMLMDLFFDTLPKNITHKTRIHFHNFMQEVHKSLHKMKATHGADVDAIPLVAAHIAQEASVLCFDEFQCTDVADAMILRRLVEALMHHGTVIVTTSNRHPSDLYKNGIQRESFIPCINLLQQRLRVLNLDSTTDYRKIPRPPSGVYHHPLDKAAKTHADHWLRFLGDLEHDPPHTAELTVWGRQVHVPVASGNCARFTFKELIGSAMGAGDYIELTRSFGAFIVTDIPGLNLRTRDLTRRFITFIDAVYESRAKLVLTTEKPLAELFVTREEINEATEEGKGKLKKGEKVEDDVQVDSSMRMMMDDLGLNMKMLKSTSIFSGDEEAFAFARALSRLSEMGSQEWVERGMGLEKQGGKEEADKWNKVRSRFREDSM